MNHTSTTLAWQVDPNGLREDYLAGGSTRVSTPSGLTVLLAADGTATWTQADGTVTVVSGTTATTAGHPTTVNEDGSLTIDNGDATTTTLMGDYAVVRSAQDGISLLVRADGSERWLELGGARVEVAVDGTVQAFDAANEPIAAPTRDAQGNLVHAQGARVVGRDLTIRTYTQGHLATLTRVNGDVETYRGDGSISRIDHADATWETHFPDGFVIRHAADGAVLGIALGGANAVRRINGGWFLAAADGTDHTFTALGSHSQDFPTDDSIVTWYGDGVRVVRGASGSVTQVLDAVGRAVSFVAVGTGARVFGPGTRSTLYGLDMTAVAEQANGALATLDQDGSATLAPAPSMTVFSNRVTRTDDGHGGFVLADSSGTRIATSSTVQDVTFAYGPADGVERMTRPDGSTRRVQEDQSVLERDAAGMIRSLILGDGTRALQAGDGTWSATAADGGVHAYAADGTPSSLTVAGVVTRFHANGTREVQYPDRTEQLDAHGVVSSKTWSDGRVETFRYGRLVHTAFSDGRSVDRQWVYTVGNGPVAVTYVDALRDASGGILSLTAESGQVLTAAEDETFTLTVNAMGIADAVFGADGVLQIEHSSWNESTYLVHDDEVVLERRFNGVHDVDFHARFDGTVEERDFSEAGTTVTIMRGGAVVSTQAPDGSKTITYGDGGTAGIDASGYFLTAAVHGTQQGVQQPGSSWKITDGDGTTRAYYPDGHAVVTHPDGSIDRWLADGSRIHITADGTRWFDTAGRLAREQAAAIGWSADGRLLSAAGIGDGWQVLADGNDLVLHAGGDVDRWSGTGDYRRLREQVAADGSTTEYTYPLNGLTRVVHSDGRECLSTISGVVHERAIDGSIEWTVAGGPTVHIATDGAVTATMNGDSVSASLEIDGTVTILENSSLSWSLDASSMSVTHRAASGVAVTLLPNGLHSIVLPDGYSQSLPTPWRFNVDLTITLSLPNGYQDVLQTDGSHTITWPGIIAGGVQLTTQVAADGTVGATHDAAGTALQTTVGATSWSVTLADGTVVTLLADHTEALTTSSGLTMAETSDGAHVWILPTGATITAHANGQVSATNIDGTPAPQAWRNGDGSLAARNASGLTVTLQGDLVVRTNVDGNRPSNGLEGDYNRFPGDGRLMLVYPDGHRMASAPDGTLTYTDVDGSIVTDGATTVVGSDGSMTITRPDGSVLTWGADGSVAKQFVNGVQVWYNPLRGYYLTLADGVRISVNEVNQAGDYHDTLGAHAGLADSTWSADPDMTLHVHMRDGIDLTVHPDYTVDYTHGQRRLTLREDGGVELRDGAFFTASTVDGVLVAHDRYGNTLQATTSDGALAFEMVDGSTRTYVGPSLADTVHFLNGLTLSSSVSGALVATLADGLTLSYAADGTLDSATLDGDALTVEGSAAVLADGSRLRLEGTTVVVTAEDGKSTRTLASGDIESLDADGVVVGMTFAATVHNLDGTSAQRDEDGIATSMSGAAVHLGDGTWTLTHADGSVSTCDVHGTLVAREKAVPHGGLTETLYGDGRIALATPEGTATRVADPRTLQESVSASEGSTAVLAADGTITLTSSAGRTVKVGMDLSSTETDPFWPSYRVVRQPDGAMTAIWFDGSTTVRDAAGAVTITTSGGAASLQEDGSYAATLADGSVSTFDADGHFTGNSLTIPGGFGVQVAADGTTTYQLSNGTAVTVNGLGTTAVDSESATLTASRAEDGSLSVTVADVSWHIVPGGSFEHHKTGFFTMAPLGGDVDRIVDWEGTVRRTQADGAVATTATNGSVTVRTRDGVSAAVEQNGTFTASLADGSISTYDATGELTFNQRTATFETFTYHSDGSKAVHYASGVERVQAADGAVVWTIPAPAGGTYTVNVTGDSTRQLSATDEADQAVSAAWTAPGWWAAAQEGTDLVLGVGDGTQVLVSPNGLWRHVDAEGALLEVRRPDGITTVSDGEGGFTSTDLLGDPVTTKVNEDGSFTTAGAWGTLTVWTAAHWSWTASNGLVEVATTGAHHLFTLPTGQSFLVEGNAGSQTEGWGVDTTDRCLNVDLHHWNGQSMDRFHLDADGTLTQTFGSGVQLRSTTDGTRLLSDPKGHQVVLEAGEHSATVPAADGVTRTVYDDGTVTATSLNGASFAMAADGTRTYTFANGILVHLEAGGWVDSLLDADANDLGAQGWTAQVRSSNGLETLQITLRGGEWRSLDANLTYTEDSSFGLRRETRGTEVTWTLPGGSLIHVAVDGTVDAQDALGAPMAVTANADGSYSATDNRGIHARVGPSLQATYLFGDLAVREAVQGAVRYQDFELADGTLVLVQGTQVRGAESHDEYGVALDRDGNHADLDALGNVVYRAFNGDVRELVNLRLDFGQLLPVGTSQAVDTNGTLYSASESGLVTATRLSGVTERRAANGVIEVRTTDGLLHWQLPDGSWISHTNDGDVEGRGPWSNVALPTDAFGRPMYPTILADGRIRTSIVDGNLFILDPASLDVQTMGSDGSVLEQMSGGSTGVVLLGQATDMPLVRHNADGTTYTSADGSNPATLTLDGQPLDYIVERDGSLSCTLPSGDSARYSADGILQRLAKTDGATLTYFRDGRVAFEALANGLMVKFDALNPQATVYFPDGKTWVRCHNSSPAHVGTALEAMRDGVGSIIAHGDADQAVVVYDLLGHPIYRLFQDFTWTAYSEGRASARGLANGDVATLDGTGDVISLLHRDGSTSFIQIDGSTRTLDATSTLISVERTGVAATRLEDGTWQIVEADGTITSYRADGSPQHRILAEGHGEITYGVDGSRVEIIDGVTVEFRADGTRSRTVDIEGAVTLYDADGLATVRTHMDGRIDVFTRNADGSVRIHDDASGTETVVRGDGSTARTLVAGLYTLFDGTGRRAMVVGLDGHTVRFDYRSDGSSTGTWDDGRIDEYDASGQLVRAALTDGRQVEYGPDGSTESRTTWPNGLTVAVGVNGTTTWTAPGEVDVVALPDGSVEAHGAGGSVLIAERDGMGVRVFLSAGPATALAIGEDGSVRKLSANGDELDVLANDGTRTLTDRAANTRTVVHPDGSAETRSLTDTLIAVRGTDGQVTRWNGDGSVALVAADGHILSITLGGELAATWQDAESAWQLVDPNGTTHSYSAATGALMALVTAQGATATFAIDGSRVSVDAYGTTTYTRADGSLDHTLSADGTLTTYGDAGALSTITRADGTVDQYQYGRLWTRYNHDGSTTRFHADDSAYTLDPLGGLVSWSLPDGRELVATSDGVDIYADGSLVGHRSTDGSGWLEQEDGSTLTSGAGGTVVSLVSQQGTSAQVQLDGTYALSEMDGSLSVFGSEGRLVSWSGPDPRYISVQVGPGDIRIYVQADGSIRTESSSGAFTGLRSPDGSAMALDGQGNWQPPALYSRWDGQGRLQQFAAHEHLTSAHDDGTFEWTQEDGSIRTVDHLGNLLSLVGPDGAQAEAAGDGTWQIMTGDSQSTFAPNGRLIVQVIAPQVNIVSPSSFFYPTRIASGWSGVSPDGWVTAWFDDGSTTTTAYGEVSHVAADSVVTLTRVDGTRLVTAADGTPEEELSSGTLVLTRTDGSVVFTFTDGSWLEEAADGSVRVTLANGSLVTRDASSRFWHAASAASPLSRLSQAPAGLELGEAELSFDDESTVRLDWADGSYREIHALHIVKTRQADGTVSVVGATGARLLSQADGSSLTTWYDGTTVATSSSGLIVVTTPDGSTITTASGTDPVLTLAEGSTLVEGEAHTLVLTGSDGSVTTWFSDGTRSEASADGSVQLWSPDGSVTLTLADGARFTEDLYANTTTLDAGRLTATKANGTSVEWLSSDSRREVAVDGDARTIYADGTSVTVSRDGTLHTTVWSDGTRIARFAGGAIQAILAQGASTLSQDPSGDWSGVVDGLAVTWRTDGRIDTHFSDGKTVASNVDGTTTTTLADGTVTLETPSVTVTTRPDGTQTIQDANRGAITFNADGSLVQNGVRGDTLEIDASGSSASVGLDGTVRKTVGDTDTSWLALGGMSEVTFASVGLTMSTTVDGAFVFKASDGSTLTLNADSSVERKSNSANRSLSAAYTSALTPSGTASYGTLALENGGHVAIENGTATVSLADGNSVSVSADGSRSVMQKDGTTTWYMADGSIRKYEKASDRVTYFDARTMNTTVREHGELVRQIDYDGTEHRYYSDADGPHEEITLTTGLQLVDGRSEFYTYIDINGKRTSPEIHILRVPKDFPHANGALFMGYADGTPVYGKLLEAHYAAVHSEGATVLVLDGQEVSSVVALDPSETDGTFEIEFRPLAPGLTVEPWTTLRIRGVVSSTYDNDSTYGDPFYRMVVQTATGMRTLESAETPPVALPITGAPAASQSLFKLPRRDPSSSDLDQAARLTIGKQGTSATQESPTIAQVYNGVVSSAGLQGFQSAYASIVGGLHAAASAYLNTATCTHLFGSDDYSRGIQNAIVDWIIQGIDGASMTRLVMKSLLNPMTLWGNPTIRKILSTLARVASSLADIEKRTIIDPVYGLRWRRYMQGFVSDDSDGSPVPTRNSANRLAAKNVETLFSSTPDGLLKLKLTSHYDQNYFSALPTLKRRGVAGELIGDILTGGFAMFFGMGGAEGSGQEFIEPTVESLRAGQLAEGGFEPSIELADSVSTANEMAQVDLTLEAEEVAVSRGVSAGIADSSVAMLSPAERGSLAALGVRSTLSGFALGAMLTGEVIELYIETAFQPDLLFPGLSEEEAAAVYRLNAGLGQKTYMALWDRLGNTSMRALLDALIADGGAQSKAMTAFVNIGYELGRESISSTGLSNLLIFMSRLMAVSTASDKVTAAVAFASLLTKISGNQISIRGFAAAIESLNIARALRIPRNGQWAAERLAEALITMIKLKLPAQDDYIAEIFSDFFAYRDVEGQTELLLRIAYSKQERVARAYVFEGRNAAWYVNYGPTVLGLTLTQIEAVLCEGQPYEQEVDLLCVDSSGKSWAVDVKHYRGVPLTGTNAAKRQGKRYVHILTFMHDMGGVIFMAPRELASKKDIIYQSFQRIAAHELAMLDGTVLPAVFAQMGAVESGAPDGLLIADSEHSYIVGQFKLLQLIFELPRL